MNVERRYTLSEIDLLREKLRVRYPQIQRPPEFGWQYEQMIEARLRTALMAGVDPTEN